MKKYGVFEFDEESRLNSFDLSVSLYIYKLNDLKDAETEFEKEHFTAALKNSEQELLALKKELSAKININEFLLEKEKLCVLLQENPDINLVKATGFLSDFDLKMFDNIEEGIRRVARKNMESIKAVRDFFEKSNSNES